MLGKQFDEGKDSIKKKKIFFFLKQEREQEQKEKLYGLRQLLLFLRTEKKGRRGLGRGWE